MLLLLLCFSLPHSPSAAIAAVRTTAAIADPVPLHADLVVRLDVVKFSPQQAQAQTASNTDHAVFFNLGPPRSPSPPRLLRPLPELADQPYMIPVSFYTVSPLSLRRLLALVAVSSMTETRRRL